MTIDHDALQARIETEIEGAQAQIARGDTKATALLTLFGGGLAGVIALSTRSGLSTAAAVLLGVALLPMAAALIVLLAAVRPRLGYTGGIARWAVIDADGRRDLLSDLTATATPAAAARKLAALSALATRMYRLARRAVDLLIAGLALVLLAVPLA
ncbi:Pycsar system effector family protein [Actinoalloteichus sp. GBA129-24]|uniref:Pycsar system effector family protein n=1 Tax=Actinoalloteichus sp. GBA129-24 TaxID=1612551 RepID=UPI0009508F68|nr:Pycsar system effector family protein [Actinoalloteichus sp. GBA129-24]APU20137.1 hypothetical protein UA75_10620 [Actinoalloteichus sp. GBA129-24]